MTKLWRGKFKKSYLIIGVVVLFVLSFSLPATQQIRSAAVAVVSPLWRLFNASKLWASNDTVSKDDFYALQLENSQLRQELQKYRDLLDNELLIRDELDKLGDVGQHLQSGLFVDKYYRELRKCLEFRLLSMPAKVIYRDPGSWSSTLWLNVGREDNPPEGPEIVAKNSPVVLGDAVIGVVDYVGDHRCCVRLITDSGLAPSVRVSRGAQQYDVLIQHIDGILNNLSLCSEHVLNASSRRAFTQVLENLKDSLGSSYDGWRLAKGELHGGGLPLWRSRGQVLKGIGFNYDYPDDYGPARDLRTGEPVDNESNYPTMPIIEVGDLLVTTGMDGVFPSGLSVAKVSKINMLKEGAYMYDIEASPVAGDLDALSQVFIIPPINQMSMID